MAKKSLQSVFINAYISTGSVRAAAEKIGVAESTCYKWLSNGLRDTLNMEQRKAISDNLLQFQCEVDRAREAILEILSDKKNKLARLKAAELIIKYSVPLRELDLTENRLAELEAEIESMREESKK